MDDLTTAYVIEQVVKPGKVESLRELISGSEQQDSITGLVDQRTVHTASIFVRCRDGKQDVLVWYLEVESDADGDFDNPDAVVRESSLFDAGLAELLESSDTARVYAKRAGNGLLIHENHPDRNEFPPGDDVVLIRLDIQAGFGTWIMRRVAGTIWWLDGGWIAQQLQNASAEVMEEEGMLTETIFLDESDDELSLLWYMESDGQEQVLDAYYETSNLVARASEVLLGTVLEQPKELLGNPHSHTNHDLLAHMTNSDRA